MLRDLVTIAPTREFSHEEMTLAVRELLQPSVPDEVKVVFLRAWAQRGESAEELAACSDTMLQQSVHSCLRGSWNGKPLLDCCGTGGGGLNLLNISTGLMFILAAMGIPVVKHGNRGMTKRSGSADVLEAMGIKIDLASKHVPRCLEEVGCAFLFAPAYHTALATVATARRTLGAEGQRTVFNLLGPLLNPTRPHARLIGVFNTGHVALYHRTLEIMKCPRFTIACGEDSGSGQKIGEVSAQGNTAFYSNVPLPDGTELTEISCTPPPSADEKLESLLVRTADESASRIEGILSGEDQGLARETLLINAAVAGWTHGSSASLDEGVAQATEALDSGRALAKLRKWQDFSSDF